MPSLIGKYVFTDIVTGRVFYADFKEMQASGGVSNQLAPVYELQVVFKKANRRIFDIVADAYARATVALARRELYCRVSPL